MNDLKINYKFCSCNILVHLIVILSGFSSLSFSQSINVVKMEEEKSGLRISLNFSIDGFIRTVDGQNYVEFNSYLDESSPGKPILPSRVFIVAIPPESKISASLQNKFEKTFNNVRLKINPEIKLSKDSTIEYKESIISNEYLTEDYFPQNEVEVLEYFWLRDFYCAAIQINPVLFNWKNKSLKAIENAELNINYYNIVPFELNKSPLGEFDIDLKNIILNFSTAQNFRSETNYNLVSDSTGNWIDYSKTHYKFAVIQDGIYRITYSDLVTSGIAPSVINPKTIKIFCRGEQLPLFISGENDLSFDPTDYIEFWAERNYNSQDYRQIVSLGQDYINYMDRYSDTTFIWLTFGGDDGKRIPVQPNLPAVLADTIKNYIEYKHFENDVRLWYYGAEDPRTQLPFWQEHKVFTWLTIGSTGSQSLTFSVSDFVPNTKVKTYARLISNAGDVITNAHRHGSSLNSTIPQDTITFDYYQTVNFISEFSSNSLIAGSNTYRVFGLVSEATFHRSLIDWVDIEYVRETKATNDSLMIIIPDSVTLDFRNIRISNLLTPDSLIIIYKVNVNAKKITGFNYSGGVLVFSDSVKGGDKYIVTKQTYSLTPSFRYSIDFVNLRNINRGADYVMITHKSLDGSTEQYKQFIDGNYDLRIEKVFIEDIYDEFAYGQNWAEAIKYFLKYAYDNWQSPAPSYLTLIGDANYDYKNKWNPAPTPRKKNLVPSYGYPVSDIWFASFNESDINIPQMYVGRIPANNDGEVLTYLSKHMNYLTRRYDDWNKRYTFYSGGDPTKPSELAQIKATNESLLNNLVNPFPVSGKGIHFYKTVDPPSNFGPYTVQEIQNAVDSSGLLISYIGHSGTRTWDNGITEVEDIQNAFPDRHPLISDFGCSTGKFAEPDVDAFGELFVSQSPNGQAIAYLGNSSLGYLSTSLRFPSMFYQKILVDSITTLSKAHIFAKIDQLTLFGYNDVNRVFNYCNILFVDPLIDFSLPEKPNFIVNQNSILMPDQISDLEDSVFVKLLINNWGKAVLDSLELIISSFHSDTLTFSDTLKILSPQLEEWLEFYVYTQKVVGSHKLIVQLDPNNLIDELYEDDNQLEFNYSIFSTSIRPVETEKFYSTKRDSVLLLNPTYLNEDKSVTFIISLSDNSYYQNAIDYEYSMDTLFTKISFNNLTPDQRYWYRARLNSPDIEWSSSYSFKNIENNFQWFIDDSHNQNDVKVEKVIFDTTDLSWKLDRTLNQLTITSAGSNDGKFASMIFNLIEYLPNTFFWGIASAEIDSITFEPYNIKYYAWPNSISQNADSLTNYINSLPAGKMLALTICDDAAQTVLGYSGGTAVRRAIETLGSLYIDSVRYRESWCLLGVKGAPMGSVSESYKKLFQGPAVIDTSKLVVHDLGYITFPKAGKSSAWESVVINDSIPEGASIEIFPLGIKQNSQIDTLSSLTFINDTASIAVINHELYSELKLLAKLNSNEIKETPAIFSIGIDYLLPAEIAINYQVVTLDKDSVYQGEYISLSFDLHNLGKASADSFHAKLFVEKPNKENILILDTLITNLQSMQKVSLTGAYKSNIQDGYGDMSFKIIEDSENNVTEIYEDNNLFIKSFYVIQDTITTSVSESSVTATFDGQEILDGDYVSSNPEISINFQYPLWFPIDDTSAIKIYLNNVELSYSDFDINYDTINRIAQYNFKPTIPKGSHNLKVFGKDITGVIGSIPGFEKYFTVSNEFTLLNLYNYPNPFSEKTSFTFILPVLPEELKINIYSIAGRKIKEIKKIMNELTIGFNSIEWDGKDEDGDIIANGSYLYKVIIRNANNSFTTKQKLSIVK